MGRGASDSNPGEGPSGPQVQWEKVLWRRQPFPDNYVPPSFLAELKTLPPRHPPRLLPLIFAALPITQHLAVIAFFLAVFHALLTDTLSAAEVGWGCAAATLAIYTLYRWGWGRTVSTSGQQTDSDILPPITKFRPLILPPLLLALLSPVLGTLTSATTSDSIWPLAGGLFFVHLLLADFTTGKDARLRRKWAQERARKRSASIGSVAHQPYVEEKSLTSSLSLTSGLSASVVLASRLPSTAHVFSLVLLSVALFAGWPTIAKSVREAGRRFSLTLTASMLLVAISFFPSAESPKSSKFLNQRPSPPTCILFAIVGIINLVGPAMLCWGWRWKVRRGAIWETPVVKVRKKRQ